MGEVVQLSKYQSKSTFIRAFARQNEMPVIEHRASDVSISDLIGLPSIDEFTRHRATRMLLDEIEEIKLEHKLATGMVLIDTDGADWMLDEREI